MIGPTDLERKSMFNKIKEIFSVPIIFFNGLGCIIAAIWLGILGEWTLLGFGILLSVLLTYLLTMLILPNLVIGGISLHFYNKGKMFLRYLFAYISIFYVNILIICTCILCFYILCRILSRRCNYRGYPLSLMVLGISTRSMAFLCIKEALE
jgi:hypothetical protein